jgi:transcriptional regulator with XRE-family HTH domain
VLIGDGVLVPGPSRNARPRVAGPRTIPAQKDLSDATRALSAGLAARRRAAGLTQAEFAALAAASVTTVGHAETGRVWQSRRFWERADVALSAGGELLRLHDAYRAFGAVRQQGHQEHQKEQGRKARADEEERAGATDHRAPALGAMAGPTATPGPPGPSCIMIVWGDGTITTVHPPAAELSHGGATGGG